jgi:hypothetical protein
MAHFEKRLFKLRCEFIIRADNDALQHPFPSLLPSSSKSADNYNREVPPAWASGVCT